MRDLATRLNRFDYGALARAISLAENQPLEAELLLGEVDGASKQPLTIGLTGAPGTGKSTLIRVLLERAVLDGLKVCVLAVDPSSPLSGGSLLADRHRMDISQSGSDQIFIRSLSSRGHLGGLSPGISLSLQFAQHFDFDMILLETSGVGQAEVEIMYYADLVGVLLVGGLGDQIQSIKSGLMEIADCFIVNKCSRPETEQVLADLKNLISSSPRYEGQEEESKPLIFPTDAVEEKGIEVFWNHIQSSSIGSEDQGRARRKASRLYYQTLTLVMHQCREQMVRHLEGIDFNACSSQQARDLATELVRKHIKC